MARTFDKNVTNLMELQNSDVLLLNNSTITACSIMARASSLTAGSPNNFLWAVPNPSSGVPGFCGLIVLSGTLGAIQIRARPVATDAVKTLTYSTGIGIGNWFHCGGQVDWANDTIYVVMNGVQESAGGQAFTATALSVGSGANGTFRIGQSCPATPLIDDAWDGQIGHIAFWTNALLSTADWRALANGINPLLVQPINLVMYRPLYGDDITEPDLVSHSTLTITGSLLKSTLGHGAVDSVFAEIDPGEVPEIISPLPIGAIAAHQMLMRRSA